MRSHVPIVVCLAIYFTGGIVCAQGDVPTVRFTVKDFVVEGDNPLSPDETQRILAPYLGEHVGLDGLVAASDALQQAISDKGFSFRRVVLPPQTLRAGVVKLRIVVFPVRRINVTGNQHFSVDNILASIPALQAGQIPNTRRLAREVRFANEHPAKHVTLTFKQSEDGDGVDAAVSVKDKKPWQVFGVLNNTGTEDTGDLRLSLGFQYNNLFRRDQILTMAYTTSPGYLDEVRQYGFNYDAPLYRASGLVSLYFVSSSVDSGLVANAFDVTGKGKFFGGRYAQNLRPIGSYSHKFGVGVDDKLFENNVTFFGTPVGVDVRSVPLLLQYSGDQVARRSQTDFFVQYAHNIETGSDNEQINYTLTRAGADVDWDALRAGANAALPIKKGWAVRFNFLGQYSGEPLIPGEQFGLGGIYSVRGFNEREVTGDNGYSLRLEIWTPPLKYGLRLLAFRDQGSAILEDTPTPGETQTTTLASAGVGLRWQWRDNIGFLLDLAYVIDGTSETPDGSERGQFNLFVRY